MTEKRDGILEVLERHGVSDPHAFVEEKGRDAEVVRSPDPDVVTRGSIQLMEKRKISPAEVDEELARLKYL